MSFMTNRLVAGLLEGTASAGRTVSELGFGYGFRVLVVGLLVVFAVLALLWGVLAVSKIFFYDIPKKKKENAAAGAQGETASAPVADEAPAADDATLVAVITAAVAAAMEAEGTAPAGGFRVVSFRRTGSGQWNRG